MEVLIFIIAFIASFVFSLGGIGSAVILVPIMISMGIPINSAKPIGLFINTVSMAGASISNIKHKRLDFKMGIPIIIFSFIFAIIGAYISQFIPSSYILILFIGFLIFSGLMFLFYKKKGSRNLSFRHTLYCAFVNWGWSRIAFRFIGNWWRKHYRSFDADAWDEP